MGLITSNLIIRIVGLTYKTSFRPILVDSYLIVAGKVSIPQNLPITEGAF